LLTYQAGIIPNISEKKEVIVTRYMVLIE